MTTDAKKIHCLSTFAGKTRVCIAVLDQVNLEIECCSQNETTKGG